LPQTIVQGKTRLGQSYEVNFENGVKVLNSENANYSFGSLHEIMLKGITEVLRKNKPANILMLGLGAGSALSILANKCKHPYKVKAIEIDQELIEVARAHFNLSQYDNLEMIQADAATEIKQLHGQGFDLVIDDIFWDNQLPEFCLDLSYLQDNCHLLAARGIYMRNTMNLAPAQEKKFEKDLQSVFSHVYHLRHAEHNNKIYFCTR
jgi:spermidine synthase